MFRNKHSWSVLCLQLVKAPSTAVTSAEANKKVAQVEAAASEGGIDDDLQARLDNLRKM